MSLESTRPCYLRCAALAVCQVSSQRVASEEAGRQLVLRGGGESHSIPVSFLFGVVLSVTCVVWYVLDCNMVCCIRLEVLDQGVSDL